MMNVAPYAQPKRNTTLIVIGALLIVVALGVGALFALNLYQYLTIEERWADDPMLTESAKRFGVRIVREAAMRRMTMFGPISGVFGLMGLVLGGLGLRKK